MTRRSRTDADEENTFAGDLDEPVTLYDTEGRALDVFTKVELTRYRAWGYSDTAPADRVDQPVDTPSS